MSPKIKMYLYYSLSFLVIYLITLLIVRTFVEPTNWTRFIPIVVAFIFSLKPHIEDAQSGRRYGLKNLFSKKIWYLN